MKAKPLQWKGNEAVFMGALFSVIKDKDETYTLSLLLPNKRPLLHKHYTSAEEAKLFAEETVLPELIQKYFEVLR